MFKFKIVYNKSYTINRQFETWGELRAFLMVFTEGNTEITRDCAESLLENGAWSLHTEWYHLRVLYLPTLHYPMI